MQVMTEFYDEIKPHLNAGVPYFTKKLAPGIAFAENPPQENESFGQSRSRIIAEAIVQAYENQVDKKEWLKLILQNIKKNGMDPDHFHLNADSHYPYQFSNFQQNSKT